jgi:hypothetical protein
MLTKIINLLFIPSLFKFDFNIINLEYDLDDILNIENFNTWFNDPNNGATYAHSGIFLRCDKLSESHFEEYFESCDSVDDLTHFNNEVRYDKRYKFMESVRKNWMSQK